MDGGARWWPHLLPVRVDRKATRQMRNGGCRYQAPRRLIEVTRIRASHGAIGRPDPKGMLAPAEPFPNQARRCRVGRCPAMRGYRPTRPTGRARVDLVREDLTPRRVSAAGTDSLPLAVQLLPGRVPRPLLPRPLRGQLSWGLPPPAPRLVALRRLTSGAVGATPLHLGRSRSPPCYPNGGKADAAVESAFGET
jgi:hypothetical protein